MIIIFVTLFVMVGGHQKIALETITIGGRVGIFPIMVPIGFHKGNWQESATITPAKNVGR